MCTPFLIFYKCYPNLDLYLISGTIFLHFDLGNFLKFKTSMNQLLPASPHRKSGLSTIQWRAYSPTVTVAFDQICLNNLSLTTKTLLLNEMRSIFNESFVELQTYGLNISTIEGELLLNFGFSELDYPDRLPYYFFVK